VLPLGNFGPVTPADDSNNEAWVSSTGIGLPSYPSLGMSAVIHGILITGLGLLHYLPAAPPPMPSTVAHATEILIGDTLYYVHDVPRRAPRRSAPPAPRAESSNPSGLKAPAVARAAEAAKQAAPAPQASPAPAKVETAAETPKAKPGTSMP